MSSRGSLLAATIGAFVVVTLGSTGSACVPRANLVSLQPRASGPAGGSVTVEGVGFDAGAAEVRWNGAGGPVLGTASGPNFSVEVTIPDVAPGLYAVVVLLRERDGGIGGAGAAAFQVTPAEVHALPSGNSPPPAAGVNPDDHSSSGSLPPVVALAVAAGLLTLGGVGGAIFTGRQGAASRNTGMWLFDPRFRDAEPEAPKPWKERDPKK